MQDTTWELLSQQATLDIGTNFATMQNQVSGSNLDQPIWNVRATHK